jgi:hypothetical protein
MTAKSHLLRFISKNNYWRLSYWTGSRRVVVHFESKEKAIQAAQAADAPNFVNITEQAAK